MVVVRPPVIVIGREERRCEMAPMSVTVQAYQSRDRVIVLVGGRVAHDGDVAGFVASARDRVWLGERPVADAVATWRDPGGGVRSVGGTPPADAQAAPPTVEDAYLLLVGPRAVQGAA